MQYLKSRPRDTQIKASLQFLLSAMNAIKRKNPLTESFLVQLDVDLEGAGLENTAELRASAPLPTNRHHSTSAGCPNTNADGSNRPPTYGDIGLASYNDPNAATSVPLTSDAPVKGSTFGSYSVPGLRGESNGRDGLAAGSGGPFDPQNRQRRSPGSQQSSGISPRVYNPDMDTSPEGSGGNDRPTPNSSTQSQHNFSSHTSNSTYSPPNMQQPEMTNSGMSSTANLFDPTNGDPSNAFTTDFDMHSFAAAQQPAGDNQASGFIMWDGDLTTADMHTGFTPGPSTGYTPGPIPTMGFVPTETSHNTNGAGLNGDGGDGGMSDFMNEWSEADWNEMMASMDTGQAGQGWETNVEHDMAAETQMHERMVKKGLIPRALGR